VAAALWVRDRREDRRALAKSTALLLIGAVLVVLPVTLRNVAVGKQFVILSAAGPETFRITNSYDSTPLNFRYPALPQMPLASWAFWRHQLLKAGFFWWGFEVPQNVNYYLFRSVFRALDVPAAAYWMLAPLFAAGLWLARREWRVFLPIWIFGLAYYLSVVAFHIVGRFRLPLIPLYAVFASYAILAGWRLARQGQWKRAGGGAGVVVLLMLVCRPWGFPLIYPVDHGNYGYILANRGDLAGGLSRLEAAERGLPGHPNLNYDMGRILLILGRPQEALQRFEREMQVSPATANVYWRAGITAKRLGDRGRAVRHLERYLALSPSGDRAEEARRELAALRPDPPVR
jgi:tetratricopeptide (TPR) repeat protein